MKTTKWYFILLVVLLLALGLSACKSAGTPTIEPVVTDANGYPVPSNAADNAYPTIDNRYGDVSELKAPVDAHTPEAGKASISGLMYVPSQKSIVKGMVINLVPAEGDNKDQVPGILIGSGLTTRGDILSRTDDQGIFYINNIPPGNYFLVISFQSNIVITSISETDLNPRLYKFEADTSVPLGLIVSPGD